MAHYECDNCSSPNGIDYGICPACTPNWVSQAKNILNHKKNMIRDQVKKAYDPIIEKEIKDRIATELAEEQKEFDLIFEAGKDWYKTEK